MKKSIDACLILSDWHIGEVIDREETENFNEYNYKIASQRMEKITSSFLDWIHLHKNIYNISKIVVLGLGDYISGTIHDELLMTQEFPIMEQVEKCSDLLTQTLKTIASKCDKLHFYGLAADNHGRITKKPVYKGRAANNYSYLVLKLTKAQLSSLKNVYFKIFKGIHATISINNFKFLITHGDVIKSWCGIPYYGIERFRNRELVKRAYTGNRNNIPDYIIMGHWHVPAKLHGVIINGALCGTTELDHGNGRVSPPVQIAFLVHPNHGAFNYVEFNG